MSEELKPCPFCGGKAGVAKVNPPFMLKKVHGLYIAAGCKQCGACTTLFRTQKMRSSLLNEQYDKQAKQRAIEAWNRRVNQDDT